MKGGRMKKNFIDTLYDETKALLNTIRLVKKNKVDIIAAIIAVIILHALIVSGTNFVTCCNAKDFGTYTVKNFILYRGDFEYLAKKLYKLYKDEKSDNEDLECINFHPSTEEWEVVYTFSDQTKNYTEMIPMSEKDANTLKNIREAFRQAPDNAFYGKITVDYHSVEFLGTRATSILYNTRGLFPKANTTKTQCSYYYLNIFACPNWYHVMEK